MTNLIRWQTHRYVLRQSVSYFANDFAGRIASNIVQAAASLRDSVVQIIDALWFVTVFAFSALFIWTAERAVKAFNSLQELKGRKQPIAS